MSSQFTYGYLKEAVRAHLDLEEAEMEAMHIGERMHIFANEAIQQICHSKPKYQYFHFVAISSFIPLVYDDGILRLANIEEQEWQTRGLAEPNFATDEEIANWYNEQQIYLVGQVITPPADFIEFAPKKAFMWADSIVNKQPVTKTHLMYMSDSEFIVQAAATYMIPYKASWCTFASTTKDDEKVPLPSDLLLTIPIYVASVCLQQRDVNMAQAKRQEFEIALSRCKSTNFLENRDITATFK